MGRVGRLLLVLLVLLPAAPAFGKEEPPSAPKPNPVDPGAAEVLAARDDAAALADILARMKRDPWGVADELKRRGEHALALTFARARL